MYYFTHATLSDDMNMQLEHLYYWAAIGIWNKHLEGRRSRLHCCVRNFFFCYPHSVYDVIVKLSLNFEPNGEESIVLQIKSAYGHKSASSSSVSMSASLLRGLSFNLANLFKIWFQRQIHTISALIIFFICRLGPRDFRRFLISLDVVAWGARQRWDIWPNAEAQ